MSRADFFLSLLPLHTKDIYGSLARHHHPANRAEQMRKKTYLLVTCLVLLSSVMARVIHQGHSDPPLPIIHNLPSPSESQARTGCLFYAACIVRQADGRLRVRAPFPTNHTAASTDDALQRININNQAR